MPTSTRWACTGSRRERAVRSRLRVRAGTGRGPPAARELAASGDRRQMGGEEGGRAETKVVPPTGDRLGRRRGSDRRRDRLYRETQLGELREAEGSSPRGSPGNRRMGGQHCNRVLRCRRFELRWSGSGGDRHPGPDPRGHPGGAVDGGGLRGRSRTLASGGASHSGPPDRPLPGHERRGIERPAGPDRSPRGADR